jgi:hypothetical protein
MLCKSLFCKSMLYKSMTAINFFRWTPRQASAIIGGARATANVMQ